MNIWILNHYATDMYFDGTGRHQSFAKYLIKSGHDVKIFCASTVHNSDINVDTKGKMSISMVGQDDVPYVFVKTKPYQGNGLQRIKNMIEFYLKIFGVMKEELKRSGKPDVILASSVHPLTLVAGIQFARKIKCPCICEVRDLWPLSIVEYSSVTDQNPVIWALYKLEHWIYKKADALIFSFSGGKQYVLDRGWEHDVDLNKIHYVNTGIDLELYYENEEKYPCNDPDMNNSDLFKIVYAGSIRKVNDLQTVVEAADLLQKDYPNLRFIIYGDGDQREPLIEECKNRDIRNVVFKGRVPKQEIPGILCKGDLLLVNVQETGIARYGVSWNKLFEYMASGKPIVANNPTDIINDNGIGKAKFFSNVEEYAKTLEQFLKMQREELDDAGEKCLEVVKEYDCKALSEKIVEIANNLINVERI